MATFDVISKCAKTVKSCFNAFSVNERNAVYLFYSLNRYYGTSPVNPVKDKYDLLVIGGGSGGLSCAKEARALNASVCVIDYVAPSPRGTVWGMGGTCVNAGCIPKKLMHQAALIGEAVKEADFYGWEIKDLDKVTLNWSKLQQAVKNHIKSVNWVIRVDLRSLKIDYINGFGKFVDEHTVEVKLKDTVRTIKADKILIAVGGRPRYPSVPGAIDYGISSDDIFSLEKPPGKTLIVGGGYIALECAGFLNTFKCPVTVMVRSVALRHFDRQMTDLVTQYMEEVGVKFFYKTVLKKIEKSGDKLSVEFENVDTKEVKNEDFDTVMFAVGRKVLTEDLNVAQINVEVDKKSGKIITEDERTSIPHIYAVGDVVHGKPELTPVAIQAGKLLAKRLFGGSKESMNYVNAPTTIFCPLEYGCVGMTEEQAVKNFGEENLEVYHSYFKPLEFSIPQKSASQCYLKVITEREGAKKILGMHYVGPSAGEVIQGYAAAMQCNITIEELMRTVGIHPTFSEEFTRLVITKRSGLNPKPQTCCS